MLLSTKAIIIKRYKIGEADRLLLAFTEELGKILVVAKSVRRTQSKLAGHIEPYWPVEIEIAKGKSDYYHLTSAQSASRKNNQQITIENLRHLEILGETIDLTLGDEEPNRRSFQYLVDGVMAVHTCPEKSRLITLEHLIKLLDSLGFRPELEKCVLCRNRVIDEQNAWSSENGGIVCHNCFIDRADLKSIKANQTIIIMRQMQNYQNVAERIMAKEEYIQEAQSFLIDYLFTHLPQPLKSLS